MADSVYYTLLPKDPSKYKEFHATNGSTIQRVQEILNDLFEKITIISFISSRKLHEIFLDKSPDFLDTIEDHLFREQSYETYLEEINDKQPEIGYTLFDDTIDSNEMIQLEQNMKQTQINTVSNMQKLLHTIQNNKEIKQEFINIIKQYNNENQLEFQQYQLQDESYTHSYSDNPYSNQNSSDNNDFTKWNQVIQIFDVFCSLWLEKSQFNWEYNQYEIRKEATLEKIIVKEETEYQQLRQFHKKQSQHRKHQLKQLYLRIESLKSKLDKMTIDCNNDRQQLIQNHKKWVSDRVNSWIEQSAKLKKIRDTSKNEFAKLRDESLAKEGTIYRRSIAQDKELRKQESEFKIIINQKCEQYLSIQVS